MYGPQLAVVEASLGSNLVSGCRDDNCTPTQTGSAKLVGNPQGQEDNRRRGNRMRDTAGAGSGTPIRIARVKKEDVLEFHT